MECMDIPTQCGNNIYVCWNNMLGSDTTHVGVIPKPSFYSTSPLSPLDSLPNRVKRRYSISQKDHSASDKPGQQTTAPSQPWLQEVRGQWQARLEVNSTNCGFWLGWDTWHVANFFSQPFHFTFCFQTNGLKLSHSLQHWIQAPNLMFSDEFIGRRI